MADAEEDSIPVRQSAAISVRNESGTEFTLMVTDEPSEVNAADTAADGGLERISAMGPKGTAPPPPPGAPPNYSPGGSGASPDLSFSGDLSLGSAGALPLSPG